MTNIVEFSENNEGEKWEEKIVVPSWMPPIDFDFKEAKNVFWLPPCTKDIEQVPKQSIEEICERRINKRVKLEVPASIRLSNGATIPAITINISQEGICFIARGEFKEGTKTRIEIQSGERYYQYVCFIRWKQNQENGYTIVGCEFPEYVEEVEVEENTRFLTLTENKNRYRINTRKSITTKQLIERITERRSEIRYELRLPAIIRDEHYIAHHGFTNNISKKGIGITSEAKLLPDERILIEIMSETKKYLWNAIVVWVTECEKNKYHAGCLLTGK